MNVIVGDKVGFKNKKKDMHTYWTTRGHVVKDKHCDGYLFPTDHRKWHRHVNKKRLEGFKCRLFRDPHSVYGWHCKTICNPTCDGFRNLHFYGLKFRCVTLRKKQKAAFLKEDIDSLRQGYVSKNIMLWWYQLDISI